MLELVATMPSRPFGAGALVTLDIISRLIRLVTVAGAARGGARGMQLSFIPQKTLTFQMALSSSPVGPGADQAGQILSAVLLRICCCSLSFNGSARNSSRFFLTSGTPGPGQSVPNRVLWVISSRRGKYWSKLLGGIPLMSR